MARSSLTLTCSTICAKPASAVSNRRYYGVACCQASSNKAGEVMGRAPHDSTAEEEATVTSSSTAADQDSISVTYRGKQFLVARGAKLRTAMLLNGVSPHNGKAQLINCRGLGTCGTCAVEIKGEVLPVAWTTAEQLRLNFPPHKAPNNQRLRLACQVTCQGAELEVIKRDKFWGQGSTVLGPAGPDDYSLPLGELEFLLDRERTKL